MFLIYCYDLPQNVTVVFAHCHQFISILMTRKYEADGVHLFFINLINSLLMARSFFDVGGHCFSLFALLFCKFRECGSGGNKENYIYIIYSYFSID